MAFFRQDPQMALCLKGLLQRYEKEENIHDVLPDYFLRTAHHIKPEKRVKIQGKIE